VVLFAVGCSADPTTSEEYVALEAERNELADQVEAAEAERDQLTGEVEGLQSNAAALESENQTLAESLDETEAELAAREARAAVWPQEMKDLFTDGCLSESGYETTAEETAALCGCMLDEFEKRYTLVEFFQLSIALYGSGGELNPVTGLPADIPEDLAMAIAEVGAFCWINSVAGSGASVFDIEVGECFDDPSSFEEVTDLDIVDCDDPHDNETYANLTVDLDSFPGIDAIQETADEMCLPEFESYVGQAWETSKLDYGWFHPTEASWEDGDRIVTCFLYDGDLAKLTGSMRDSGL